MMMNKMEKLKDQGGERGKKLRIKGGGWDKSKKILRNKMGEEWKPRGQKVQIDERD